MLKIGESMKLECKDGHGNQVIKECDNPEQIKGMLARGWKEVKSQSKPKTKSSKKGKK